MIKEIFVEDKINTKRGKVFCIDMSKNKGSSISVNEIINVDGEEYKVLEIEQFIVDLVDYSNQYGILVKQINNLPAQ